MIASLDSHPFPSRTSCAEIWKDEVEAGRQKCGNWLGKLVAQYVEGQGTGPEQGRYHKLVCIAKQHSRGGLQPGEQSETYDIAQPTLNINRWQPAEWKNDMRKNCLRD